MRSWTVLCANPTDLSLRAVIASLPSAYLMNVIAPWVTPMCVLFSSCFLFHLASCATHCATLDTFMAAGL